MRRPRTCTVSVVIPTRNEAPNIQTLVLRCSRALESLPGGWELVFVDDSDDETPAIISELAGRTHDQVRLHHRAPGDRRAGLGGAVQAGFAIARGGVIAVMDADLQHPPEVLPALVAPVLSGEADLATGSRYGDAGGTGGLDGPWRRLVSWGCRWLAHRAVPASRPLQDPLSGLFAFRRSVIEGVELHPDGYKILLEVAARGKWQSAVNVGYDFAERNAGFSKAGVREGLVYFRLLARLARVRRMPEPYASGALVITGQELVPADLSRMP